MENLKLYFYFLCVITFSNAGLPPQEIEDIHNKIEDCMKKTGCTDTDLVLLMNNEIPTSQEGLCFSSCMEKSLGMLTADNKIDGNRMKDLASPLKNKNADKYDKLCTVIDNCAAKVPANPDECAMSKDLLNCCQNESKAIGLKFTLFDIIS